jgi:hypothetical protein
MASVVITACAIASVVVNFQGVAKIDGRTFGPNESVVSQCVQEPQEPVAGLSAKIDQLAKEMEAEK